MARTVARVTPPDASSSTPGAVASHRRPVPPACRGHGGADVLAAQAEGGEVIVLDEDAVEEADAVVVAAAAAHGVFLQESPTGQGLAGVEDLALQPGDGLDVAPRLR